MRTRKKWNQETVIETLSSLYPTLDFSHSQYLNMKTKIEVSCPKHGAFLKLPPNMIYMNQGCPECGRVGTSGQAHKYKNVSQSMFIREANDKLNAPHITIHKDTYTKMSEMVDITCAIHGNSKVKAKDLFTGTRHCKACGLVKGADARRADKDAFFSLLNLPEEWSIDLESFTGITKNVKGECTIHGKFETKAYSIVEGKGGCPRCRNIIRGKSKTDGAREGVLKKLNEVHGDTLDLSLVRYTGAKNKILLVCPDHGGFEIRPHDAMRGVGCPYCSGRLLCPTKFQSQVDMVHGAGRYTCQLTEASKNTVPTICNKCGHEWEAYRQSLRNGIGCPVCEVKPTGFDHTKPGIVYAIKFILHDDSLIYKIGITNHHVTYRIEKMEVNYKVVKFVKLLDKREFKIGGLAFKREQEIHRALAAYRYEGDKFLVSGFTELYHVNPLDHIKL